METLSDIEYNKIIKKFHSELIGYTYIRENYIFGQVFTFKHFETNKIIYILWITSIGYQIMNEKQLIQYLKDTWDPHSQEGIQYFITIQKI